MIVSQILKHINGINEYEKTHTLDEKYIHLKSQLENILTIAQLNESIGYTMFNEMRISKFNTFDSYVRYVDMNIATNCNSNERTKLLRAKRINKRCPECGEEILQTKNEIKCESCGFVFSSQLHGSTKQPNDANKHISKQIGNIIGIKRPPNNIKFLIPYITTWLTDLKYLHSWLIYRNKLNVLPSDFDYSRILDRIPENKFDTDTFKIIMDEFQQLLETIRLYGNVNTTRFSTLQLDKQLLIVSSFIDTNNRIPKPKETYLYENIVYEIGSYVLQLSINPLDDHPIAKLFEEKGFSIYLPGLSFNACDILGKCTIPKKYNFIQEYIYIIHEVFNYQYIDISSIDQNILIDIIVKFNNFFKERNRKEDKDCNSPLFCCVLRYIIEDLPYFNKYKRVLDILQIKDENTTLFIAREWFIFKCTYYDELLKYSTIQK